MSNTTTQVMTKIFAEQLKARDVLPIFQVEYQEISKARQFWLWVTRQERPIKHPLFPVSEGDTITFRRPNTYGGDV